MATIKFIDSNATQRYECFECGAEMTVHPVPTNRDGVVGTLDWCPECGERENFFLMN